MNHNNQLDKEFIEEFLSFNRFDNSFLNERKIFLWGVVMDETAKEVVDRLMYLESKDPGKEIKFYINSPGGVVTSGMAIHDTMRMISSPVTTICMGLAASMGSLLLAAGEKGKRLIFPNGRVMIHQPSIGGIQGQAKDLEITTQEILKTREIIAKLLAEYCGHDYDKVFKDFNRDYWMNAEESVNYSIVDGVIDANSF